MKKNAEGWWDVEPRAQWTCPECGETTPSDDWEEREAECEDCGAHDGRECPKCGEVFDHVWGARRIEEACVKSAEGG